MKNEIHLTKIDFCHYFYDAMYSAEVLFTSTRDDLAVIRFAADEDLSVIDNVMEHSAYMNVGSSGGAAIGEDMKLVGITPGIFISLDRNNFDKNDLGICLTRLANKHWTVVFRYSSPVVFWSL